MARKIALSDLNHPGLDVYARLTENQLRNRLEPEKGIFIAQTPKVISLALDMGCAPVSFLMEEENRSAETDRLLARLPKEVPVYVAKRAVLQALTGFSLTRGMLSAMRRPVLPTAKALLHNARRVALLDGVADASNMGAILRSAAALNLDGVLVCDSCCDPLNRRAVRVSMGTVFQVPWTWISAESWPEQLHAMGFSTAALALREDAVPLGAPQLAAEEKLALALGSEGWGLPQKAVDSCDYTVRIPMRPGVDSLNVAAAAAVAFWELGKR